MISIHKEQKCLVNKLQTENNAVAVMRSTDRPENWHDLARMLQTRIIPKFSPAGSGPLITTQTFLIHCSLKLMPEAGMREPEESS